MKELLIFLFVIVIPTSAKTQNQVSIGAGYPNEINVSFLHTKKRLILELRQGLGYQQMFQAFRYNTYILAGINTDKENIFMLDIAGGVAYSWMGQNNSPDFRRYNNQFCPTLKTSMYCKLRRSSRFYMSVDVLLSSYEYYTADRWGDPRSSRDLTASFLLSLNYLLQKEEVKIH